MHELKAGDLFLHPTHGCILIIYKDISKEELAPMWFNGWGDDHDNHGPAMPARTLEYLRTEILNNSSIKLLGNIGLALKDLDIKIKKMVGK